MSIDPAMYLQAAEMLLQGKKPYVDFIDINPPLIIYLSSIPVLLAKCTGFNVIIAFKILLLGFVGLMSFCLRRALSASEIMSRKQSLAVVTLFIWVSALMVYVRAGGQREHLFMLAFVPYLFLRLGQLHSPIHESTVLSFFLSITCGIMACLKPHFIFIIVCLELSLAYTLKSKRTLRQREVLAFLTVCLIYVLHFLFLPSDIRHAFFSELVPFVSSHYSAFGKTAGDMLTHRWYNWVGTVACIVLLFVSNAQLVAVKRILAFVGLASVFIYFQQGKGWYYHFLPMFYFIAIAAPLIFSMIKADTNWVRRIAAATMTILIIIFLGGMTYRLVRGMVDEKYLVNAPDYGATEVAMLIKTFSKVNDRVVIFSPSPLHSYPALLQLQRYPGTRYLFLFPVSFFNNPLYADPTGSYNYKSLDQLSPAEATFVQQMRDDMLVSKPQLLVFTKFNNEFDFLPDNFNIFDYFVANGLWGTFLDQYQLVSETPTTLAYQRRQ